MAISDKQWLENMLAINQVSRVDGDTTTPIPTNDEIHVRMMAVAGYTVLQEVDIPPYNRLIQVEGQSIENTTPLRLLARISV